MLTRDTQNVGTSLEVLASYLRYRPAVEYPLADNPYGETMRRTLVGLNIETEIATLSNETTIWAAHCKLVLRPFSALTEPLEDGTVPAVEALRRALGCPMELDPDNNKIRTRYEDSLTDKYVRVESFPSHAGGWIRLCPDTGAVTFDAFDDAFSTIVTVSDPLDGYDWLRANHFALPVNGRPLIEGVDYIAKSATPPATEKGDSGE